MSKEIKLITKGATEQISTVIVGAGRMSNPLIIKAQKGVHYELRDTESHIAPYQVLLVRKGKDLMIKIDPKENESDKNTPADIIIQNYYGESGSSLVGMSEDGQYYNYVPQEGNSDLFSMNMDNNDSSYQSLGYSEITSDNNWEPYALGALALGILAAAVGGGGNKSSDPTNNPPADTSAITDTTPPKITETTENNSTTASQLITIDTTPPALTAELDPTSDSGIVGDGITNDTTPTISGT
ncbi:MAG: hypothetical protein PHE73_02385, partial [Sulfurovaceae bacterium]|nr:hypothetical protein [Sulfurovaceae bacterium]